jgi:hypothetical protein
VTGYETRIAQVRVNSENEWKLRVFGTDIYRTLYRHRDPDLEPFPGNAMGHRLIELGWMPDRRATLAPVGTSVVQKVMLTMLAGWTPSETEENVWEIPVHRECE